MRTGMQQDQPLVLEGDLFLPAGRGIHGTTGSWELLTDMG